MNKKNITRHPGVRNLVKVEKNNWNCFEDCCWDCPCDACTTYGEIQPAKEELDKEVEGFCNLLLGSVDNDVEKWEEAKEDYEADRFYEDRMINS